MVPNLKQINLVHRLTPHFFLILLNVALATKPVAPERSLYVSRLQPLISPIRATNSAHFILLDSIILVTFDDGYKAGDARYAIFSSLVVLSFSYVLVFAVAPSPHTCSIHVLPLGLGTKLHIHKSKS